jgi:hypothetical protein
MLVWNAMPSMTPMVGDLLARRRDLVHGLDDLAHDDASLRGHVACRIGQLIRRPRGIGVVLDGAGELLHGSRRLLQVRRLLLGALRQVQVARGDLARSGRDAVAALAHLRDDTQEIDVHRPERREQRARLVGAVDDDLRCEIALGHGLGDVDGAVDRQGDRSGHEVGERRGHQHRHGPEGEHHEASAVVHARRVLARLADLVAQFMHEAVDRRLVACPVGAHAAQGQVGGGLLVPGLHQADELPLVLHERGTVLLRLGEEGPGLRRLQGLVELLHGVRDLRSRRDDLSRGLLDLLGRALDQRGMHVAHDAVDVVLNLDGQQHLRVAVVHDVVQLVVHVGQPGDADSDDARQQQQDEQERHAEAHPDFQVPETLHFQLRMMLVAQKCARR